MTKCTSCEEQFEWDDTVIRVADALYHIDCVTLYPTGYVAFADGECLGETENDDGEMAFEIIEGLLYDKDDSSKDIR